MQRYSPRLRTNCVQCLRDPIWVCEVCDTAPTVRYDARMRKPRQAIQSAKVGVQEMPGLTPVDVEEIERDEYRSRDVWSITLSFPRNPLARLARSV